MTLEIKSDKLPTDNAKKLEYLYRLQEKLRLVHNEYGEKYRNEEITEEEFRTFQRTWFEPRSLLLCSSINECKSTVATDTSVVCSIEDIEET